MGRIWSRMRADAGSLRRYARRLDTTELEPPLPPPLPAGTIIDVPGRGEMLVREVPGPEGAPTILLLHGWTLSADLNWFTFYDAIGRHGRVLAVDHRGHGRGIRSEQPFTLDAAADDAAAVLEQLGAGPAVVLGYSMGGSIGLLMWRRHPELVSGLVLQSTALQWRSSARDRLVWSSMAIVEYSLRLGVPRGLSERYLRQAVEDSPDLEKYRGWVKGEVRRGDPSDIAAAGRALSAFDARSFVGDIDVATAVIVSCRDRLVSPRQQRELAEAIPQAHVIELDAAHNGWLVRPDALSNAIDEALEKVIAEQAPGAQTAPANTRAPQG